MEEKVLQGKKNGMLVLLVNLLVLVAAIAGCILCAVQVEKGNSLMVAPLVLCIVIICLGWIPLCGLRVLKPQEAVVLTLFGKYVGTLKGDGFFWVNPFCSSYNPAAGTKLNQSGDVKVAATPTAELIDKKIPLKIMTLSNSRQKINDCLGNPVEISIAVTWRVKDTAKAVFNVNNYKEFLSLQCDSALRNIVRLYP